jgi:hypothetical protein
MSEAVPPEFVRFVATRRRARRAPAVARPLAAGQVTSPISVGEDDASKLLRAAALRACGLFHPTRRTEVVWVSGASELAVDLAGLRLAVADGLITVRIPVRCDQAPRAQVEVPFAVGTPDAPAGLFAATYRRPSGPPVVVEAWGAPLVAFAWQCLLGLASGVAGAMGKDSRGNVLVPVELTVVRRTLQIVPMARHRFTGSSGLGPPKRRPR